MRGERGFIYGRWYIGYRGFAVSLVREWEWGYEKDWYDGPLYFLGLGFIHLSYLS
jgi:hypothetical protein